MWKFDGAQLDQRLTVFIYSMIVFNGIPFLLLVLYFIVSSIAIYSSAILVHLISFLFALAIFAPVALFSSLTALIVSLIIIGLQRIFAKDRSYTRPARYQQQLKMD